MDSSANLVSIDLHPWNHCHTDSVKAANFSADDFHDARQKYLTYIKDRSQIVEDAITGNKLKIDEQLLDITTASYDQSGGDKSTVGVQLSSRQDWYMVQTVKDLSSSKLILEPSPDRKYGRHDSQPVLMCAAPGTGKTWSSLQLLFKLANDLLSSADEDDDSSFETPLVRHMHAIAKLKKLASTSLSQVEDVTPPMLAKLQELKSMIETITLTGCAAAQSHLEPHSLLLMTSHDVRVRARARVCVCACR